MSVPPPAIVLLGRIHGELRRLRTTKNVVLERGPGAEMLEKMAGDRLRALVENVYTSLETLERAVKAGGVTPERLTRMADLQRATDRVTSECLALALGALARIVELEAGACEEADQLILDLAGRINRQFGRPTVPGESEHLNRAADVIRRRIPDHGLWDLPIMAHEFGHVVASGLTAYDAIGDQVLRPVEGFLEQVDSSRRGQVTELFCDVFATFALGPSYPCALILHRLDPMAPAIAADNASHPGDACRVHGCLWTLRMMQRQNASYHPYDRVLWQLDTAWQELQRRAPESARLDEQARAALATDLSRCWVALRDNLGAVRYQWSEHVHDLVDELNDPAAEHAPAGYSPADVLNAAWIVRLDMWSTGTPATEALELRARPLLRTALWGDG